MEVMLAASETHTKQHKILYFKQTQCCAEMLR